MKRGERSARLGSSATIGEGPFGDQDESLLHLANASAIRQYEGIRHTDGKWDAFWLAQLLLLGIQPEGYIYPKAERSARERKRPLTFFIF